MEGDRHPRARTPSTARAPARATASTRTRARPARPRPRRRLVRRLHARALDRRLDGLPAGRDPDARRPRPGGRRRDVPGPDLARVHGGRALEAPALQFLLPDKYPTGIRSSTATTGSSGRLHGPDVHGASTTTTPTTTAPAATTTPGARHAGAATPPRPPRRRDPGSAGATGEPDATARPARGAAAQSVELSPPVRSRWRSCAACVAVARCVPRRHGVPRAARVRLRRVPGRARVPAEGRPLRAVFALACAIQLDAARRAGAACRPTSNVLELCARSRSIPRTPSDDAVSAPHAGAAYLHTTSVYGPAFSLITRPLGSTRRPKVAAWSLRVGAAIAVLVAAWFASRRRPFSAALVGWNPVVAVHFAGGGHNDALMLALVSVALALGDRGKPRSPEPPGRWPC